MRLLSIVLSMVALIGCGPESSDKLRVQIFTGAYSSTPVHVADQLGFFKRYGLDIQKERASSSSAALAAMIGGSIDIVESGADLVLANIDKGTKLKFLMSNESTNYVTLVVGSHIENTSFSDDYKKILLDLRGKRIGVNAIGSTLHLATLMMLRESGLSADDVHFVSTGSAATTLSAWQAGSVDAQITFAPIPELLENLGLAKTSFVLADTGPEALRFDGLYGGWVTTQRFLDNHQSQADNFILAMSDAINWIRDPANKEVLLEITRQHAPVSALTLDENDAILSQMIQRYKRYWGYEISPEAISKWNNYAMYFDLINEPIKFERVVYEGAPICEKPPCQ